VKCEKPGFAVMGIDIWTRVVFYVSKEKTKRIELKSPKEREGDLGKPGPKGGKTSTGTCYRKARWTIKRRSSAIVGDIPSVSGVSSGRLQKRVRATANKQSSRGGSNKAATELNEGPSHSEAEHVRTEEEPEEMVRRNNRKRICREGSEMTG